jgi:hypothetical protein
MLVSGNLDVSGDNNEQNVTGRKVSAARVVSLTKELICGVEQSSFY